MLAPNALQHQNQGGVMAIETVPAYSLCERNRGDHDIDGGKRGTPLRPLGEISGDQLRLGGK